MIFSRLNKLAHTTKFKVEWVDLGKLPFHGVLLFIVNGWIKFSAYRKPTQTANNLHLSRNHLMYVVEVRCPVNVPYSTQDL